MTKLLAILLIGLVFESAGVVLLKKGMTQVGEVRVFNWPELRRVAGAGLTNPQILMGVGFEALFFGCLLVLMARSDISFLWPLTGLSFVFATLAAIWFLHEEVSAVRWVGVVFIMIGAALISYSEQHKARTSPAAIAHASGPPGLRR